MSEGGDFLEVDTRSLGDDCLSEINGEFTPSSDGIFNSTPRNGRSLSYIDVSRHPYGADVSLSATTWRRTTKGLSQSICDLRILREKQLGRRERSILVEDNFLQEHAKKLDEARAKIRALEAKYGSPHRLRRPHSNLSAAADRRERVENGIPTQGLTTTNLNEGGGAKLPAREGNETNATHKTSKESSSQEDSELTTKVTRRSLNEELNQLSPSDDRSEIDSGISTEGPSCAGNARKARTKKRRPVTWGDGEELYSSEDTNSVSSHGSGWRRRMEIIPERRDGSESLCCRGYEGNQEQPNFDDTDSNLSFSRKEITIQRQRPAYHTESRHKPKYTREKTKWQSMPNLSTNYNYDYNQNRQMMYGEAIPVDPNEDKKKNNSKFGKRSGLYVVNDSPEKMHQELPVPVPVAKKKITLRRKLFHKNSSSKKCPSTNTAVSAPKGARSMGRVVGLHATNEAAYVIELNRSDSGSFGFFTQKGYSQYKKGIFISKIADKRAAKFFAGLLHVGDELVEINNASVQDQNLASVNKLINNSDKLLITILPYSSRNVK